MIIPTVKSEEIIPISMNSQINTESLNNVADSSKIYLSLSNLGEPEIVKLDTVLTNHIMSKIIKLSLCNINVDKDLLVALLLKFNTKQLCSFKARNVNFELCTSIHLTEFTKEIEELIIQDCTFQTHGYNVFERLYWPKLRRLIIINSNIAKRDFRTKSLLVS